MEINKIYEGDCIEVLKTLEENSVDSIVTDPPYGLGFMGKEWDTFDKSQFGQAGLEGENDLKVKKNFKILPRIAEGRELQKFTLDWAKEVYRVLKPGGYLLSFGGTRTYHRMACAIEDAGFEIRDMVEWIYGSGFPKSLNIGKKVEGWEGWGTALKPAHEPICMARKPLQEKTVVDNVLKWGTGGINIDRSRVGTEDTRSKTSGAIEGSGWGTKAGAIAGSELGRFPANLIHDGSDEVVEFFPNSKSSNSLKKNNRCWGDGIKYGKGNAQDSYGFSDFGSSARFFYCAKTSKSERGENNIHPTVKPLALMKYLIKLVTPPQGIVLDPFAGSGSTLVAAKEEGFKFIGIEKEPDYVKIVEARLRSVQDRLL